MKENRSTPRGRGCLLLASVIATVCLGCASPQRSATPSLPNAETPSQVPATSKRAVVAVMGDITVFNDRALAAPGATPGADATAELVNAGLTLLDTDGRLLPQLAAETPTLENGLWKLLPDGRMELTWRIRPNARWHDGTAFTTDDLLFSYQVARDAEIKTFNHTVFSYIESMAAPDLRTLVVRWKEPYISVDTLFAREVMYPLPRHLLEPAYLENKATFLDQAFWSEEYVGSGPFRVAEFVRGVRVNLVANEDYVLGRPRLDSLEVRFITDPNTIAANLLADTVDVTIGRTLALEQAVQVREQWRNGTFESGPYLLIRMWSQFNNPQPPALLNVQFRRALLHAIDRQALVDTFQAGLTPVSHSFLPSVPQFAEVNRNVVQYAYDPQLATRLIEELGYVRGPDGFYREAGGERVAPVEMRSLATAELQLNIIQVVADGWKRLGIDATTVSVPTRQVQDREYLANRPGFYVVGGASGLAGLRGRIFHSSEIPREETSYVGANTSHYASREVDALYDRWLVTIPKSEQELLLGQLLRRISEDLPILPLFYNVEPTMISHRMANVGPRQPGSITQSWNAHQWDLK